jgi:GPI mannosyltransferase 2
LIGKSSYWAWYEQIIPKSNTRAVTLPKAKMNILQTFATPQIILIILVILSYHVQIITRLSSGYPVWYWWIAKAITSSPQESKLAKVTIYWMIMYAIVQGGLFSSFLPPA